MMKMKNQMTMFTLLMISKKATKEESAKEKEDLPEVEEVVETETKEVMKSPKARSPKSLNSLKDPMLKNSRKS